VKIRHWSIKEKGGRLTPHSCHFYTLHLELFSLDVLRVLGEQTLETNKEVKYPSVPGPSLAKEVKDSSLTILFSHRLISTVEEGDRA
jgi:hypothetical protein